MYEFNRTRVLNRIKEVEYGKAYWIQYDVPEKLEDTLTILIEQDLGDDKVCVLDDLSEKKDGRIIGEVLIEFHNEFDFEILFSKACQFDMLSQGYDLIEDAPQI